MVAHGEQLELDLFDVGMTLKAFRDSRYQSTAFAVAELIDNSVDAEATFIDVLFVEREQVATERHVRRVSEIAVADDGCGMSGDTLVTALRFGGRGPNSHLPGIRGKYGVGLPISSLSQCRRVDVWSWQDGIASTVHCYLDVGEIEDGRGQVPAYDLESVPAQWIRVMNEAVYDSVSGTLVVWSDLDQVNEKRADTVMRHMEQEVGRIYRHFIAGGEVSIWMSMFDERMDGASVERQVRPNDPMYLMPGSSTPAPWDVVPMFEERRGGLPLTYSVTWNDKDYTVNVRYSKVKDEALRTSTIGGRAGRLPHGQHAARNTGISVVREGRELVRVVPMVGRHDERNRWWGCEIRFDSGLDSLFGVDHNKQMASHLTQIIDGFSDDVAADYYSGDDDGNPWHQLVKIVRDVKDETSSMRREVENTLKQIRDISPGGGDGSVAPVDVSVGVATTASRRVEDEGEMDQTATDIVRAEMDDEAKVLQHTELLVSSGVDDEMAGHLARVMVERGDRYAFVSDNVPGSHMFSVKSRAGVIYVTLNIDHPAYEVLRELEESLLDMEDPSNLSSACVALRLLLLSWASAEDHYHDADQRRRVQDMAGTWGKYAATFFDVELAQRGG